MEASAGTMFSSAKILLFRFSLRNFFLMNLPQCQPVGAGLPAKRLSLFGGKPAPTANPRLIQGVVTIRLKPLPYLS
jgi:hypothetical protein